MFFAIELCLILENVYGRLLKLLEMDWQLVASYFTVKSTDIFLQCTCVRKRCSFSLFYIFRDVYQFLGVYLLIIAHLFTFYSYYSRPSLSRFRLSRITAYLEEKI